MHNLLDDILPRLSHLLDRDTVNHCLRVAQLSTQIGRVLRLDPDGLEALKVGSLCHDVGKGVISPEILNRPRRLLPAERKAVEEHALAGVRILSAMAPSLTPPVFDIVRHHHERLDGSGYPDQLCGDQISLPVRIVALADVYDALISQRPYRRALTREEALNVLAQEVKLGRLDLHLAQVLKQTTEMGRHTYAQQDETWGF